MLEAFALTVWNIGTRAPYSVLLDIVRAFRNGQALMAGTMSFIVGLVFVAAATVLILPAVNNIAADFVPIQIFTFLAALALEYLIGNDMRRFIARVAGAPRTR
ncbi:MAG: hypothetical protein JO043_08880 [Candidatus Eremiobacteraeota bacterium]|nr:hypothetical protein [Candidatus Eremiobacteraeota bacterium]